MKMNIVADYRDIRNSLIVNSDDNGQLIAIEGETAVVISNLRADNLTVGAEDLPIGDVLVTINVTDGNDVVSLSFKLDRILGALADMDSENAQFLAEQVIAISK